MIRNVVFDLGGVLVGLDLARCQAAFRAIGLEAVGQLIDPCHPNAMMGRLEHGEISWAETCEEMRRMTGNRTVTDDEIAGALCAFLTEVPVEKLRAIERLRQRGIRTYVLSNNNPVGMAAIRRLCAVDGRTMEAYFDKIYVSCEMKLLKPSPEIFRAMLADSGMRAEETLFIDDSERNVAAACALGFETWCPKNGEDFTPLLDAIGPAVLPHEKK